MRAKKSKEANLEGRKKGYLLIGVTVACALSLTAFEWTTYERTAMSLPPLPIDMDIPEEVIEPFRKEQKQVQKQVSNDKVIIAPFVPDPEPLPPIPDPVPPTPEPITWDPPTFEPEPVDRLPFTVVEEMPEFIGGEEALFTWLGKNTKFPAVCSRNGIQGKVWVKFVVDEEGEVRDVKVLNEAHKALQKEAERVVKAMPAWKPGKQQGQKVKVYYTLPISFVLD